MKAVMISIRPKRCELIANGKKTIEVRKTKPKLETPFKCYIYCTQGEALAYPHLNNPRFHFMRTNNGTVFGRKMTVPERNESDYTFANGKVIGEFVCDTFVVDRSLGHDELFRSVACISEVEAAVYCTSITYGWHISDLKIYDKPKELSEFTKPCINNLYCESCAMYSNYNESCGNVALRLSPPQSWCYCEELANG